MLRATIQHETATGSGGDFTGDDAFRRASRFATRCVELAALRVRLAPGEPPPAPPTMRLDTQVVIEALAPGLPVAAARCLGGSGPAVSVRRLLLPMPRERRLAIDVIPQAVAFDPADLRRLLQELVDNALRYSAPRSTVRVRGAPGVGGYQLSVTNPGPSLPRWALAAVRCVRQGEAAAGGDGLRLGLLIAGTLARRNTAVLEVVRGGGRPNTVRVVAAPV
jgi:hypothetical protein